MGNVSIEFFEAICENKAANEKAMSAVIQRAKGNSDA